MILKFVNSKKEEMTITIKKPGHDQSWSALMSCDDREFKYEFLHDGDSHAGTGVRGDDALWVPYGAQVGLKIIANNPKYQSLQDSLETVETIKK